MPPPYRPVSTWAVVALAVGFAALATLLVNQPAMWSLPVVGVALALVAWRDTRPPEGNAGRKLAALALAIAVSVLAADVTRFFSRRVWARREAIAVAEQWIEELRQGRRRAAHQITLPVSQRCPAEESLNHCYRNDRDRQDDLENFAEETAPRQMLFWGRLAEFRLQSVIPRSNEGLLDRVELEYAIDLPAPPDEVPHVDDLHDHDAHDHPGHQHDARPAPVATAATSSEKRLLILLERTGDDAGQAIGWRVQLYKIAEKSSP